MFNLQKDKTNYLKKKKKFTHFLRSKDWRQQDIKLNLVLSKSKNVLNNKKTKQLVSNCKGCLQRRPDRRSGGKIKRTATRSNNERN